MTWHRPFGPDNPRPPLVWWLWFYARLVAAAILVIIVAEMITGR